MSISTKDSGSGPAQDGAGISLNSLLIWMNNRSTGIFAGWWQLILKDFVINYIDECSYFGKLVEAISWFKPYHSVWLDESYWMQRWLWFAVHSPASTEFLPTAFAEYWIRYSSAGEILEYSLEFHTFICLGKILLKPHKLEQQFQIWHAEWQSVFCC